MRRTRDELWVTVWCGGYVECAKYDDDLCALHRIARERDGAERELEEVRSEVAVDGVLRQGLVAEIRKLRKQGDAAHKLITMDEEEDSP